MHGKKVHFIIMGFAAFCLNPVPEIFIVDDMIASHQTCQIKGLAGSIQGNSAVSGILIHRLGGDMLMTIQKDIRPDFIRDSIAVDALTGSGFAPAPPKDGFDIIPMWVADMNFPLSLIHI